MAEVQCLRVQIKPGQTERLVGFLRSVRQREAEVQESLALEGVILESLFIERGGEHDYLVFYTRAEDLAAASAAFAASTLALDGETRQIIAETWAAAQALELVVDLERAG